GFKKPTRLSCPPAPGMAVSIMLPTAFGADRACDIEVVKPGEIGLAVVELSHQPHIPIAERLAVYLEWQDVSAADGFVGSVEAAGRGEPGMQRRFRDRGEHTNHRCRDA